MLGLPGRPYLPGDRHAPLPEMGCVEAGEGVCMCVEVAYSSYIHLWWSVGCGRHLVRGVRREG